MKAITIKKFLSTILVSVFFLQAYAQNVFTVKIDLNDFKSDYKPALIYQTSGGRVTDTVYKLVDGAITFQGSVSEPTVANIVLRNNPNAGIRMSDRFVPGPPLMFILSNDVIVFEGHADEIHLAKAREGEYNLAISGAKESLDELSDQQWNVMKTGFLRSEEGRPAKSNRTEPNTSGVDQKIREAKDDFISRYPNSLYSAYLVWESSFFSNYEKLNSLYTKLGEVPKKSTYAKEIQKKLNDMKATAVGNYAVAFSKVDESGKMFRLEDFRGKYVLLDFWGSWCGPCRASHPHLNSLYAKYKSSGFEIVGIAQERFTSAEANMTAWKNAIEEDGMEWTQLLNNDGRGGDDVVKAYGVAVYPTKFLLDKDGKVLARYTTETSELDEKLKGLFGF